MSRAFHPCIVIPCYNHATELAGYLPAVAAHGLPIIVVDDGSAPAEAELIRTVTKASAIRLIRLEKNGGKWHAMLAGMKAAREAGFTHVLQCDADGQHDAAAIPGFISASQESPHSLILGQPHYGADVPAARLYGRRITNFFVWLETAGACRCDAMCGFRLYPLQETLRLLERYGISPGMAGDIELLVRCYWSGMKVIPREIKVCYPEGGRSNFRMLRDNLIISRAHTKLCTAALLHPWRLVKAHKTR